MILVKRWGVMTLVVLLVLGTMGAALADEPTSDDRTHKTPRHAALYLAEYEWAQELTSLVHFWVGPGACTDSEPAGFGLFLPPPAEEECTPPVLTGPRGQLNHGSMVSSFVHWLKDGGLKALAEDNEELQDFADLPKGQLVKMFAHEDFGKQSSPDLEDEDVGDGVDGFDGAADEQDGHGPPAWVVEKNAEKKAEKANKGKNK